MTHRERVKAAIHFERPDRLPCNDSFWEDTIPEWHRQGMPADVAPEDYFDFDICSMCLDTSPRLEQKLLRREGPYIIYRDRFGYTVKKLEGRSCTMEFLEHVTVDRSAWERLKGRFALSEAPQEPARIDEASYFAHFAPYPTWQEALHQYQRLYASGRYMLFLAYGPWEATWRHRGYTNQLLDTALDPDWLKGMADTYQDLVIAVLSRCLELGMRPDGFFMLEDLACNKGMIIAPDSWRRIFRPATERLGQFLAAHGLDFWMHSDGNLEAVFEDLIECGLRVIQPLDVSAGLDVRELRKRYGRHLAFYGNISVKKMLGPLDQLEEEIRSKVSVGREGGYVFHSDHSIPPQVSLERYRWVLATARRCFLA